MENSEKDIKDLKSQDLAKNTNDAKGKTMTTNQGIKVNDTNDSLKAGERGPTLLEDFILREKIFHFDHERIPERVVHARGSAAHGYFELWICIEITCPFLLVLLLAHCVENTRHNYGYACVFRLVVKQNNCL